MNALIMMTSEIMSRLEILQPLCLMTALTFYKMSHIILLLYTSMLHWYSESARLLYRTLISLLQCSFLYSTACYSWTLLLRMQWKVSNGKEKSYKIVHTKKSSCIIYNCAVKHQHLSISSTTEPLCSMNEVLLIKENTAVRKWRKYVSSQWA